MNWVDSHAHVYASEFDADRHDCFQKALDKGVETIYMPNVDSASIDAMMEVELRYPFCIATMGLHPCYVKKGFEQELYQVESWLARRPFAAIGEIGIDLYWDTSFYSHQVEAFRIQVEWAKKYNRPIIIHCRNSFRETMDALKPLLDGTLKGIFHCFGGTLEEAQEVLEIGFTLGIGGVATFKKAGLDQVLPHIGLEHIVLETDSPYLAPVPYRGKRNEPVYIPLIAAQVAQIKSCSLEELSIQTSENCRRLFTL
ncbi:MAG: TatD family hydrolase [Cytophagaceae bacterium]|jgi:TatD DNase family protein|nr:TatD family hydrolase [Cytophagaceae bacterium]